ncbi:YbaY family lipoprotein [Pseudomonas sp. NPDC090755]|uniref:YbaY family lipoprotein n=1 Tax=Pseudomonas sp. NPDC090755 TaxID=3364481 RepID=UPI003839F7D0
MPDVDFKTLDVDLIFVANRLGLPAGVSVTLNLADVSRADAPAISLAQQTLLAGRAISFNFQLRYDSRMVDERSTYALQARIEHEGKLILINTVAYHVTLDGTQDKVTMKLEPVR